jgi:uncharacterized protein (TIGR02453 family)
MTQIDKSTLAFLKALKENNNRDWFLKNKKQYELAKENFIAFIDEVIKGISKFDKEVKGIDPKSCLFRINRDIRFSANKAPYKTNIGASISPGGKKSASPGYYIHIEPGNSFLAGGKWMPEAPELAAIRQEIDYHSKEFNKIILNKDFVGNFKKLSEEDKLKTAPKGYKTDHPDIEVLKLKSFIVDKEIKDKELLSPRFAEETIVTFKALKPLNDFLGRALDL